MTARACPITGEEIGPDRYASPAAAGKLRAEAASLPDLARDLDLAVTRQVRMTQPAGGSPRDQRLPYNPAAAEIAYLLRTTVLSVVDTIAHDQHDPTPDTWETIATYLAAVADRLTLTARGAEQIGELLYATAEARRVIDRPRPRRYAGPCPGCGLDLTAPPHAVETVCPACDTAVDIGEQIEQMHGLLLGMVLPRDHAVHAAQTITGVTITRQDLHNWTRRGKLATAPHPRHQVAYRVADLATLAAGKLQHARTAV